MQRQSSYKVHLNTICNGELSDPLYDSVNRDLILVKLLLEKILKFRQCIFASISPWKVVRPFFVETYIPFTQGCFVSSFIEIGPVVLEEKKFNLVQVFLQFHNYPPIEKSVSLHLNKLEFPLPRDVLCLV